MGRDEEAGPICCICAVLRSDVMAELEHLTAAQSLHLLVWDQAVRRYLRHRHAKLSDICGVLAFVQQSPDHRGWT